MITVTKIAQCYLSSREKSIYNLYIFVFNIALILKRNRQSALAINKHIDMSDLYF